MRQVAVVGGGAAGLVAAISAARRGASVTIVERNPRVGKKLLATGNGRCNLSNSDMRVDSFLGQDPAFAAQVTEKFNLEATLKFFGDIGIVFAAEEGRLYPRSMQASGVLDVLRHEVELLKIEVQTDTQVKGIKVAPGGYLLTTTTGNLLSSAVIIATGGKAGPQFGCTGDGYDLARSLGHTLIPPSPALVGLQLNSPHLKGLAGLRMKMTLRLGELREHGEVIFTNYGISGIPIFDLSAYLGEAEGQQLILGIEDKPYNLVLDELTERFAALRHKTCLDALIGYLPKQLAVVILKEAGVESVNSLACDMSRSQVKNLTRLLTSWPIEIKSLNTWEQAQTTRGGIITGEIYSHSLESKKAPGVFFAGEVMDIHGRCGGYNLQWAWSSGFLAGTSAASHLVNT